MVDIPTEARRIHSSATPNVGGVGIGIGIAVGLLTLVVLGDVQLNAAAWAAAVGGLVIFGAGVYDDIRGMGFKQKFFMQVLVAYGLLHFGFQFDVSWLPFIEAGTFQEGLISIPLSMLWLVGMMNAVNLIDGIDGLAGGVATIASLGMALLFFWAGAPLLAAVACVVAASTVGFLHHNYEPAKVFMGDTGSLTLGYIVALLPLAQPLHADPLLAMVIPAVLLGLPIIETTLTIVRRLLRKKAVCGPDANHLHHRLMRQGSVRSACLTLYGVGAWFGVIALLLAVLPGTASLLVVVISLLMITSWIRSLGYLNFKAVVRARRLKRLGDEQSFHKAIPKVNPRSSETYNSTGDGSPVPDITDMHAAWTDE
jgi:UDP-GlcNAc:undecaprenyl-phosphate GlcNAc-1-phosphate transferase